MQWEDDHKIETPELVEVSLEIAGLGSRFVAQLFDWLVKWGALVAITLLVVILSAMLGAVADFRATNMLLLALVAGLFYAFLLGFDIFFEVRRNGQTPGKRLAGIRVIRDGGGAVDFQSACIRNLLGLADFLPAFYLLGAFIATLSKRGQRLGDMAGGTIVIRERSLQAPADLERELHIMASDEYRFTPDQLTRCSPQDRHILRSFVMRYRQLEPRARWQLANSLTDAFVAKLPYPDSADLEPEVFLATLYRELETWARARG